MDAGEQIRRFQEFFEDSYKEKVLESVGNGKNYVIVNFKDLLSFDVKLAEELLETPENTIKAAEVAAEEIDIPSDIKNFRIRFSNLPETQKIMIGDVRSNHIGKLLVIDGIVRQKSDVRPHVVNSRFECPNCGNVISLLQIESTFREPDKCGCGRKGKFKLLSKDLVDAQAMVLEESPDELEGGEQPKRMNVFLKEDLVSPITDKKTNPGSRISAVGVLKEIPIVTKGSKSTRFDLLLETNYVEAMEESFYEVQVTKEEEKQIIELSQDPKIYERLVGSIAPSIYGYDRVKESLLLQLMGGIQKKRGDGVVSRGDLHVLLVGDPGSGKSQLLKRISLIAPKGRYVSGKGASAAGLTAAVVRDEFLGGWSLEAGALVLANNGVICIDEMDKMTDEDRGALHEGLEQQQITIAKANIQATLVAKTTVLAAANPKFGRFDPHAIIAEQIDMPPTLINRFDLIFPIKDLPDVTRDEQMATHILNLHQNPEFREAEIPTQLLKKYIVYARQKIKPMLTDAALNEIKEFYVQIRNREAIEERAARSVPISPRQLEALIRLSEASARVRLSRKVTKKDARKAIELLTYCLLQVGLDRETGRIDIDRISTGIGASQRERIYLIKDILQQLETKVGKTIPITDLLKEAVDKGMSEGEVEETLEKLKRTGDIYEPRYGFLSRI